MSRPAKSTHQDNDRYNIRALDRAISILSLLTDGTPRTPAEISEKLGLSPSTTFRMVSTLAYYRYVRRDKKTNQYQLGLACLELAQAYLVSDDVRMVALPELEALRDETKETIHLAVLDEMEIVYLGKLAGLHAIGMMSSRIGGRAPAFCTGVGKILLAYQDQDEVREYYRTHAPFPFTSATIVDLDLLMNELIDIQQQGFAFDRGEHENEVRCVATPIFNLNGQIEAAISISGPSIRMDPLEENHLMIERAKQTALNISRQLGHIPQNKTLREVKNSPAKKF
jgi:DNA-binding IclR family transcriptional regulator